MNEETIDWATLREASEATGASLPALRRWYREGLVRSVVVPGSHGAQRLVDLEEVRARALASPRVGRRAARGHAAASDVTSALIAQVASMAMEIAELRERVETLEADTA